MDENMLTFDLVALTDWMNLSEIFDERIQSVWNLLDDASVTRIVFERLYPHSPPMYVTVDLEIVRRKAYYHGRIKQSELALLIEQMKECQHVK